MCAVVGELLQRIIVMPSALLALPANAVSEALWMEMHVALLCSIPAAGCGGSAQTVQAINR
jgi:hypothetical protein